MRTEDFSPSYVGERRDVQKLVLPTARSVLDVGCSTGAMGAAIKQRLGARVVGIEMSERMAEVASQRLDQVFVGDVVRVFLEGQLRNWRFDTIIFADVLEHLVDPWTLLLEAREYLEPDGVVIASLPNVKHWDTMANLVFKDYWPYRERGIHDRTHLRFFARRNVRELFEHAGFRIEKTRARYRIIERPHRLNRYARLLAIPGLRGFLAFQYIVRARRKEGILRPR